MYCPQCKAEYRQGFTRCVDCDVELVAVLSESPDNGARDTRSSTLVPLWEGEDLALHTTLLEELETAHIPYFDRPLGVFPGVRRADPFPIQPLMRFGYKVAVLSSDLAGAQEILERLLGQEPENMSIPGDDDESQPMSAPVTPAGEETTSEVWTGEAEKVADFLNDALRENQIPARVEVAGHETKI